MINVVWSKSKSDGCNVYRWGDYEIVSLYEGGHMLCRFGCFLAEGGLRNLKEYAVEHERFN